MIDPHQVCSAWDWEWVWMANEPKFEIRELLKRVVDGEYDGNWVHEPWQMDVGPYSQTHVICVAIFHATVKACLRVVYLLEICGELRGTPVWNSIVKSALSSSTSIKSDICTTGDGLVRFLGKNEVHIRKVSSRTFSLLLATYTSYIYIYSRWNSTNISIPIVNWLILRWLWIMLIVSRLSTTIL